MSKAANTKKAQAQPTQLQLKHATLFSKCALIFTVSGWPLVVYGERSSVTAMYLGALLLLLAFISCIFIIRTGISRLLSVTTATGLDELQLYARLEANSTAFKWFFLFALESIGMMILAQRWMGYEIKAGDPSFYSFFVATIVAGATFPVLAAAKHLNGWSDSSNEGEDA